MVFYMKTIMFTFESIYVKKIGGLSEVPPRLGEALESLGVNVELYTPSHSSIDTCREPVFKTQFNGVEYCIARLNVRPVHYVVGGGILDDPVVYPIHGLHEKAFTFARVLYEYFSEIEPSEPVVFHGHDWHSIPALVAMGKLIAERGYKAGMILHFHLGTRNFTDKDIYARFLEMRDDTLIHGALGLRGFREYYELSHGLIERLGALLADKVVTVSRGYMKKLSRIIGLDNSSKLGFVFNASPLTWDEACSIIRDHHGVERPGDLAERRAKRQEILTKRLSDIVIRQTDPGVKELVDRVLDQYGVVYNKSFKQDGPLIFMVGRLSKQKGFDLVARALDSLVLEEPRVKLILAGIPSQWDEHYVRNWVELSITYEENLRFLPGVLSREDLVLLYYVSNLTLIPSRTEPFGLVALESMATGTPVAASRLDGLADIVIDIRSDHERGNGVLFEYANLKELTESVTYLLELTEELHKGLHEPRVRENAIKRASEFKWRRSAEQAYEIYRDMAIQEKQINM